MMDRFVGGRKGRDSMLLLRWDVGAIDSLPECMKVVYRYVLSTYENIEREALERQKSYIMPHAIETVKVLCRTYTEELKRFVGGDMPTFDKYMEIAVIIGGVYLMFLCCFIGMESATNQITDWLLSEPRLAVVTGSIGRWEDNLGSCERENKGGQVVTAVEEYMKQEGLSKEETLARFVLRADDG